MSRAPNPFGINPSQSWERSEPSNPAVSRFLNAVYAWMCVGLLVTGGVAWLTSQNVALVRQMGSGVLLLFVVEIVLVMTISRAIERISAPVATVLFLLYAAINGVVLSSVFLIYAHSTLFSAFLISGGTFGAMSVYGMVTRRDLTSIGRYLMMGLIGLIIASVVSFFWHNSLLQVAINYLGVLIFIGLTAYDTQKMKQIAYATQENPALAARLSIVGSLILYLDFINLFLFILRILGDRRN